MRMMAHLFGRVHALASSAEYATSTMQPGKNPRSPMVISLMDSACPLIIRMVIGSLCGIELSLCSWGIRASPVPAWHHEAPPSRFEGNLLRTHLMYRNVNSIGGGKKPSLRESRGLLLW